MSASRVVLVDGHYMMHRTLKAGMFADMKVGTVPTGGVYGFIKSLQIVLEKFDPDHCIVVFDSGLSQRRKSFYPEYKSNRVPKTTEEEKEKAQYYNLFSHQVSRISELLKSLCVHEVMIKDREGDDVINFLCKSLPSKDIIVLSDDKDMITLVDERVSVYRPIAGKHVTHENIKEHTDLPTSEHYLWFKSIVGDGSDNIGGIKGVAEGTALKVVQAMKNLTYEDMKEACDQFTPKRYATLKENIDIVKRNRKLVDMDEEVFTREDFESVVNSLEFPIDVNMRVVECVFNKYAFESILRRLGSWIVPFRRLSSIKPEVPSF